MRHTSNAAPYPKSQILRFSPTGGNSLHAVRCVRLLNTQLAANQVINLAIAITNFAVTTLVYFCTRSLSRIHYTIGLVL